MRGRGPVVHLDRSQKAKMISAILEDYLECPVAGFRTLDIGCGNGGISEHFAAANEHYGVDVSDQRANKKASFDFRLVNSAHLPFEDAFFDIVISHHVIEHVDDLHVHLDEIARVLKPTGIAYLATPNRSSPIMQGHVGNDQVLRYREMEPLFRAHGFDPMEYGVMVASQPARFHGEVRLARFLPLPILKLARPIFPSHMFVMRRTSGGDA